MLGNYIGIDWGSTNLRAWLFNDDVCVDVIQSEKGITRLNGEPHERILRDIISHWQITPDIPIIMAGMIGSNAGWIPVPYLDCPVNLGAMGKRLTRVATSLSDQVYIVPGVCTESGTRCNVMRGEEVQLAGADREHPARYYVMPGTHSKWVEIKDHCITDFSTMMTGELHHLLLNQSLIGAGIGEQQSNDAIFYQGLNAGLGDNNIVRCLFETRAAHVLGKLNTAFVSEWLSGLLIGYEVAQMQQAYAINQNDTVVIVGNKNLSARYARAMSVAGMNHSVADGDRMFNSGIRGIAHELAN